MGSGDCVFCKIASGEIPARTVFSTDEVVCFMDINPVAEGHVLVVPRGHAEFLWQLSPEQLSAVGEALVRVTAAVKDALGARGINVLQNNGRIAGQLVPHVHFHVIPRFEGDEFRYTWPAREVPDEELKRIKGLIAERIK